MPSPFAGLTRPYTRFGFDLHASLIRVWPASAPNPGLFRRAPQKGPSRNPLPASPVSGLAARFPDPDLTRPLARFGVDPPLRPIQVWPARAPDLSLTVRTTGHMRARPPATPAGPGP